MRYRASILFTKETHTTIQGKTLHIDIPVNLNADVIPRIKINTDAMARTIQLVQEEFVKVSQS